MQTACRHQQPTGPANSCTVSLGRRSIATATPDDCCGIVGPTTPAQLRKSVPPCCLPHQESRPIQTTRAAAAAAPSAATLPSCSAALTVAADGAGAGEPLDDDEEGEPLGEPFGEVDAPAAEPPEPPGLLVADAADSGARRLLPTGAAACQNKRYIITVL
jgi:hypothetical protein